MPAKQSLSKDKVPAEGLKQLLSKAFRAGHTTVWEQEELLDAIHWLRQILAIVAGVAFGLIPMKGLNAILMFIAMNLGGVFSWYRAQRLDEELYGGHQALLTEGLPPSIALFLLVWIIFYTVFHTS